jgi:hypothetical protein
MKFTTHIFLLVLILSASLFAQTSPWAAGAHFIISLPQSDFANLSKDGEGIGGKLLYRPGMSRYFALRSDLNYISYGEKRNSMQASMGYFLVQVRNESFQLTLGPQLSLPVGRFTAYVAPMGGLYNYRTVASVPELYYYYGYPASNTTTSLTRWGWNVNGGLLIDIGIGPHIDIGAKYQKIAKAVKTEINGVKMERDATDICICIGVTFFLKSRF